MVKMKPFVNTISWYRCAPDKVRYQSLLKVRLQECYITPSLRV